MNSKRITLLQIRLIPGAGYEVALEKNGLRRDFQFTLIDGDIPVFPTPPGFDEFIGEDFAEAKEIVRAVAAFAR